MQVNHLRMFLNALRTAIVIVSGFIAYEMLLELKKISHKTNLNFAKRMLFKLAIIFLIDLILLYIIFYTFKVEL